MRKGQTKHMREDRGEAYTYNDSIDSEVDGVAIKADNLKIGKRKHKFEWLKAYQYVKGQSGNPAGRPKSKTLKEFAREMLLNMSDYDRVAYLKSLDPKIIWTMAEGNPHQTSDTTVEVTMPTPILGGALLPPVQSQQLEDKPAPTHRIAPASTKDATQ